MSADYNGPCYLINERDRTVLNVHDRWDYFRIDGFTGHRRRRSFDSPDWKVFPSVNEAERYVKHTLRESIFDFAMELVESRHA